MNWQEAVVYGILLLCLVYIGVKVIRYFRRRKEVAHKCADCDIDCALRSLKEKIDCKQQ